MDRPKGSRLSRMSADKYEELISSIISFVKERTKTANLPTFDELSQKFDLSYNDLATIGSGSDFTINVAIMAGGAIADLPTSAWSLEWLGD